MKGGNGMLSQVHSCCVIGIDGSLISVETDIRSGLPSFSIVGLPESAVKESRERVSAAIVNSGYDFPLRRITVNLAPADIRKTGTAFDLAIAVGVLSAIGEVSEERLGDYAVVGELALDGALRSVRGILSMALAVKKENLRGVIVPEPNAREAVVVEDLRIVSASRLGEVVAFLNSDRPPGAPVIADCSRQQHDSDTRPDMSDIRGQETVKRALEVACAGGHNLLMIGPPGAGKTMIARRIPTILPPMTVEERIETTRIHSVSGTIPAGLFLLEERPFRSPHHTISDVGLAGGGSVPRPGEVSLAHNGVLFLDEFPEFKRRALEVLRQPLEDGCVHISRASFSVSFPARFMLVAAMNPCPCGYYTDPSRSCLCGSTDISRYLSRISGPLLDRIDIHIQVPPVRIGDLMDARPGELSRKIADRIALARRHQALRFEGLDGTRWNAHMSPKEVRRLAELHPEGIEFLRTAIARLGLSARAFFKILKVARTIADLEGSERVEKRHVAEATQYRTLDRSLWGDA